jgi:hypothetical protein
VIGVNGTRLILPVPSFVVGVILGPICANLIDARRWGSHVEEGQIAYVSDPARHVRSRTDRIGFDATGHWYPDGQGRI